MKMTLKPIQSRILVKLGTARQLSFNRLAEAAMPSRKLDPESRSRWDNEIRLQIELLGLYGLIQIEEQLGIPYVEMDELLAKNAAVMEAIRAMFTARGLDLWDIKIEWGLTEQGQPLIIDEISPGCCRAFKAGTRQRVAGLELAELFRR